MSCSGPREAGGSGGHEGAREGSLVGVGPGLGIWGAVGCEGDSVRQAWKQVGGTAPKSTPVLGPRGVPGPPAPRSGGIFRAGAVSLRSGPAGRPPHSCPEPTPAPDGCPSRGHRAWCQVLCGGPRPSCRRARHPPVLARPGGGCLGAGGRCGVCPQGSGRGPSGPPPGCRFPARPLREPGLSSLPTGPGLEPFSPRGGGPSL